MTLEGGVLGIQIQGKVSSSSTISINGWVEIAGDVKTSGQVKIRSTNGKEDGMVKIGGKIDCNGGCVIEGDMVTE